MNSTVLSSRQLDGLLLTERLYPAELFMPNHTHTVARLSFVLAGGYTEEIARRSRLCGKSMLLLHPPGEAHEVRFQTHPVRIFSVEFDELWMKDTFPAQVFETLKGLKSDYACHLSSKLYAEFNVKDQASLMAMEGLVLELLAQLLRQNSKLVEKTRPDWLRKACEILNDCFREDIRIKDVAQLVNVHPAYLMREFRRFYGCTMGEYIRKLRINFVVASLIHSKTPISQIAIEAGFYDQAHCINVFRKMTGMSPSEFRKKDR